MARRHFGLDVLRARIAHTLGESDRTGGIGGPLLLLITAASPFSFSAAAT